MEHSHQAQHPPFDDAQMVAVISAEGEVARSPTDQAIDRTCSALGWTDRSQVERIVDACTLAAAFPAATVVAVDRSSAMLAAATRRAEAAGVDGRIETVARDLDDELTALGALDLAWAALSLHHLRDSSATLTRIAAQLRAGGALCMLERHTPLQLPGRGARSAGPLGARGTARSSRGTNAPVHRSRPTASSIDSLIWWRRRASTWPTRGRSKAPRPCPASTGHEMLVTRHVQMALRNFGDALEPADVAALDAPTRSPGSGARRPRRPSHVFWLSRLRKTTHDGHHPEREGRPTCRPDGNPTTPFGRSGRTEP